jgi:hypothetical protein
MKNESAMSISKGFANLSRHNGSNFNRGEQKRILSHQHTIGLSEERYDFTIEMGFDKRDSSPPFLVFCLTRKEL